MNQTPLLKTPIKPKSQNLTASMKELAKIEIVTKPAAQKTPYAGRKKIVRYAPEVKQKLTNRIGDLYRASVSEERIVEILAEEGFKNSDGVPLTGHSVRLFITKLRGAEPVVTPAAPLPAPAASPKFTLPKWLIAMLDDETMGAEAKLQLIRSLAG